MASSLSRMDRLSGRWCATYPPKGDPEALATVTEDEGAFDVSVTAVGWAFEEYRAPARACREATLEAARAKADILAAELLGREVLARWRDAESDAL